MRRLTTNLLCKLAEVTNRNVAVPLVFFSPTSRCNSRCLSCDWWRATGEDDLTLPEIETLARACGRLHARLVVFTGGEPLLRSETFEIAETFRREGAILWLLTSGTLLNRHVEAVATHFDRVTISLDASTPQAYRDVRGLDALPAIEASVARLRTLAPEMRVSARATLHRANFRELPGIVQKAKAMGLTSLSFLAADVSSAAFGRSAPPPDNHALLLERVEIEELRELIDGVAAEHADAFDQGFIEESVAKLHRVPQYYTAMQGEGAFPPVACNAPWVSVVVEANGQVRPCFFHTPVGSIRERSLPDIVASNLREFRRELNVATNLVCRRCVCSLKVGMRSALW